MSSEHPLDPRVVPDTRFHGRRFVICWLLLSAIVTPVVVIFARRLPPGDASVQSSEQVFDNTVIASVVTPVLVFVVLFVGYVLVAFRAGAEGEELDGPSDHGSA